MCKYESSRRGIFFQKKSGKPYLKRKEIIIFSVIWVHHTYIPQARIQRGVWGTPPLGEIFYILHTKVHTVRKKVHPASNKRTPP
jgi:hypothetical protein